VSSYPTETADINLRMMDSIRDAFKVPVGLSDHTTSTVIPAAAVARGACVIEKHFTLSRSLDGPDHSFALEPAELSAMVSAIREVDEGLGSSVKGPVPVVENLAVKYKYLVSDVAIPVGTTITTDMLTVKRGGHGILPVNLEIVVGRKAAEDIPEDKLISWEMV
jgi:N-acetylneuraminate synthase/N,N'-diacetyllegionaminate synthase